MVPLKPGDKVPSIQEMYFAAFSYENETHDLYGVRFINMKLDFGGHFFNLAAESPMTIISPESARRPREGCQTQGVAAKPRPPRQPLPPARPPRPRAPSAR